MIERYFYEDTGMYIDWDQLKNLPEIDTLIDIGVGDQGTPELYNIFPDKKLILIDPLEEAYDYALKNLKDRDYVFYKTALGSKKGELKIKVEKEIGRSGFLQVTKLNYEGEPIEERNVKIELLDNVLNQSKKFGRLGLKIDTEGYEIDVIKGATNILKSTKFVIAEVRHNHKSFEGSYKIHEFMEVMRKNNFQLSMIFTAKPLIADLCFQPLQDLEFN